VIWVDKLLEMKVDRKLYDFSVEQWNKNMETETKNCETKTKILWRKWKRNGTTFSDRTDAEIKISVSD
jgi:hypothetical protein